MQEVHRQAELNLAARVQYRSVDSGVAETLSRKALMFQGNFVDLR